MQLPWGPEVVKNCVVDSLDSYFFSGWAAAYWYVSRIYVLISAIKSSGVPHLPLYQNEDLGFHGNFEKSRHWKINTSFICIYQNTGLFFLEKCKIHFHRCHWLQKCSRKDFLQYSLNMICMQPLVEEVSAPLVEYARKRF